MTADFYQKKWEEVLTELNATVNGLTSEEVEARQTTYGTNCLTKKDKQSLVVLFVQQFKSFLVGILLVAAIISFLFQEYANSIIIFLLLLLNGMLGFFQEYKADRAMDALAKLSSPKCKVKRDEEVKSIDSTELVPGDIVLVAEGDKISADLRIIEAYDLIIDESTLTGESESVHKNQNRLSKQADLSDQINMLFAGTLVHSGRGTAVVVTTGMSTILGEIASRINIPEEQTPLQINLATFGKKLGIIILFICLAITLSGMLLGNAPYLMLLTGVALAVAAIPEGLPIIVTIALALGVQRMASKNALIRKLSAVETLGCTTVICTDKTGTLTYNEMSVRKLYVPDMLLKVTGEGYSCDGKIYDGEKVVAFNKIQRLLTIGLYNNDATLSEKGVNGDPTEIALLVSAAKGGVKINSRMKRLGELPFDSTRKMKSTLLTDGTKTLLLVKGAPEEILARCTKLQKGESIVALSEKYSAEILSTYEEYSKQAMRVLAFAYKETTKLDEQKLIFVGLQAMIDPPRREVKDAILRCHKAGIQVKMITGDHALTAQAIAALLGIEGKVVTGKEIDAHKNLSALVAEAAIFARVNPYHKNRIVEALRKNGEIVAMTGDGVNDAPALKKADIGIAMGKTGTEVAKEASDMVLLDDQFITIVRAVEEGRGIYNNIKKFINYLLTGNLTEVLILFLALIIGFSGEYGSLILPLTALHILWINLVTDGLPALALGIDPISPVVMEKKPRGSKVSLLDREMTTSILTTAVLMVIAVLALFSWALKHYRDAKAQTLAFTLLVLLEITRAQMVRISLGESIIPGKWLSLALLSSLLLQLLVIYSPLHIFFGTFALQFNDWMILIGITLLVSIAGILLNKGITFFTPREQ